MEALRDNKNKMKTMVMEYWFQEESTSVFNQ
jgi:hypothetical protein